MSRSHFHVKLLHIEYLILYVFWTCNAKSIFKRTKNLLTKTKSQQWLAEYCNNVIYWLINQWFDEYYPTLKQCVAQYTNSNVLDDVSVVFFRSVPLICGWLFNLTLHSCSSSCESDCGQKNITNKFPGRCLCSCAEWLKCSHAH